MGAGGGEANKPPPGDANPRARQANTYTWLAEKALDCCLHPVKTTSLWRRGREKNENRQKFWMPDFSPLLSFGSFPAQGTLSSRQLVRKMKLKRGLDHLFTATPSARPCPPSRSTSDSRSPSPWGRSMSSLSSASRIQFCLGAYH